MVLLDAYVAHPLYWEVTLSVLTFWLILHYLTLPRGHRYIAREHQFKDPTINKWRAFPSLDDDASLYLSLVVPAFREEKRLPIMMDETMAYLEERAQTELDFTYEVIIVDDGSPDGTTSVGHEYSARYGTDKVRVLTLSVNRGKGGAVKKGVLHSRGEYILFVDADGATDINDLNKLETEMEALETARSGYGVVCGSRAHLQDEAVAERSFLRNLLMYGFHILVSTLCIRGVRDTQCGFKLFSRRAARRCFYSQHLLRWAFDVELLYIAQSSNIPIGEVSVNWQEIDGSTLNPITAALQMARDLIRIRLMYMVGIWSMQS